MLFIVHAGAFKGSLGRIITWPLVRSRSCLTCDRVADISEDSRGVSLHPVDVLDTSTDCLLSQLVDAKLSTVALSTSHIRVLPSSCPNIQYVT